MIPLIGVSWSTCYVDLVFVKFGLVGYELVSLDWLDTSLCLWR
jgi:hypothetical protein